MNLRRQFPGGFPSDTSPWQLLLVYGFVLASNSRQRTIMVVLAPKIDYPAPLVWRSWSAKTCSMQPPSILIAIFSRYPHDGMLHAAFLFPFPLSLSLPFFSLFFPLFLLILFFSSLALLISLDSSVGIGYAVWRMKRWDDTCVSYWDGEGRGEAGGRRTIR